jgi:hypothetical protein
MIYNRVFDIMNLMTIKNTCIGLFLGVLIVAAAFVAKAESPARELSASQKKSVQAFVDRFDTIVFGSEYDKKFANTIVYKWQGPVRIYLQYSKIKPNPKFRQFINNHLIALRRLTKLPMTLVGVPKVAKIKIVFLPRKDMGKLKLPQAPKKLVEKLAQSGGCYFIAYKNGPGKKQQGRIHSSIIVVNAQRDIAAINHCLLEELTQSLGLPNDSNKMRPSIFSDKDRLFEYAPIDKALIRVLYDKRMTMGVSRQQGLTLAEKIFSDVVFKNELLATSHKPRK